MLKEPGAPPITRGPRNDECTLSRADGSQSGSGARVSCSRTPAKTPISESFREVRCGSCRAIFYLCPRDDRGQRYCSTPCRQRGWRRSRRAARKRHRRSDEGRADHRDRERERRRRARQKKSVGDQGHKKLAHSRRVCPRDDQPQATDAEADAPRRRTRTDETQRIEDGHPTRSQRDEALADERTRRGDEGTTAVVVARTSPGCPNTGRSDGAVVPAAVVCCAVCGRVGRTIRDSFLRRARVRREESALRGGSG